MKQSNALNEDKITGKPNIQNQRQQLTQQKRHSTTY